MFFFFTLLVRNISDNDPLVTQDLVDKINSNPKSTFKAKLYPQFASLTRGDVKKFLSPVRPSPSKKSSAYPVGAKESDYPTNYLAITFKDPSQITDNKLNAPVFDVNKLCSTWAPATTAAVSLSVSRWANRFINFSLQYILDCDILGDACLERSPISAYHLFWQNKIPEWQRWDMPGYGASGRTDFNQAPVSELTRETCDNQEGCYPGTTGCSRSLALTGTCKPGDGEETCPIYYLYNWRWIKSHLFEVGPVTSSIIAYPSLFTYSQGVYTSDNTNDTPLGMIDVTIIGWGEDRDAVITSSTEVGKRWWWVIPHLGNDFGISYDKSELSTTPYEINNGGKGFMKFNRRYDDCLIESQAVGPVPYNFIPEIETAEGN